MKKTGEGGGPDQPMGTMGHVLLGSCGLEEYARRIAWLERY